ncbi:CBS domain-containing protein [Capillibacterium thermochitinicola]|uniref:CBS domain-containing protein n=1 Tax=Capillibacterium thermochitinicola TaxID=2699427 RepID=A0A8J6I292_9FIRM|nr:CBS domain-containing protein [Capillibacterium thermochitinicola]MBA2133918.1 CBS domain-containing protein [Capillibacterium thermochitinicola]
MNVAFYLTPKEEVVWIAEDSTMRQALEKMEYHRYSAMPLVNKEGKYAGTITEGDLLWSLKRSPELSFKDLEKIRIKDIPRYQKNEAVSINAQIEELIPLAVHQNFIPVVDDQQNFIGIVKRSTIINYLYQRLTAFASQGR